MNSKHWAASKWDKAKHITLQGRLLNLTYRSHRNSPRKTNYFERCASKKPPLVGLRGVPARSVNYFARLLRDTIETLEMNDGPDCKRSAFYLAFKVTVDVVGARMKGSKGQSTLSFQSLPKE